VNTDGSAWATWASAWPTRREERGEVVDDLVLRFARQHLPQGRVLDAGSGDGTYAARLAAAFTVTGVDATPELVDTARRRHPGLPFDHASLEALPYRDGTFDGVFCLTVLEWVDDPLTALRELRRVTRPGGVLVLGVLGAGNGTRDLHVQRFGGRSPMNGLLPWELELLCEREGLRVQASLGVTRNGPVSERTRADMTRVMIWLVAVSTPAP